MTGGFWKTKVTPLKFNSEFSPEKWWERKTSLSYWVSVTFQGLCYVKLREGKSPLGAARIIDFHHKGKRIVGTHRFHDLVD